ncbi:MAG TPA: thioesterase family protein [Mycobacteriales bacterium]|nr:thioesterase family protein [Mycobacteriales bacterium]
MSSEAFYVPIGPGTFRPTPHTVGPWAATDQHGGPPSALLVRALEQVLPPEGGWLARISVDLLGAVPVQELTVTASVVRPGRSVQLAVATLAAGGRDVARATGWWHRFGDTIAVAAYGSAPELPDQPDPVDQRWPGGYLQAMEWRRVKGDFAEPGPAVIWSRMRLPLVEGAEPSPTQRLLVSADSGNGAASALDLDSWLYVNTELTVHVLRPPAGEWICLDAATTIGPTGGGYAITTLSDVDGEVGRGAQALIVRPR